MVAKPIRVRFAPSPTGPFSLGNARTALFNWLFARHEGGVFLLRIEDTDKERSEKKYEDDLIKGLTWLGLTWDEKIVHQSERGEIYQKYLTKLLEEHHAYYCFCSPEELENEREAQLSQGLFPRYGGKCKHISYDDARKRAVIDSHIIRFLMPEKKIVFHDIVRGKIEFDTKFFGDIVIAKSVTEPLYNFAVVIDDYDMQISHVIRGEDHLSNTPKQIVIHEALGFSVPEYGHLPLILGPDRKKLSKRFLTQSLNDYGREGYLSDAVLNFLVLLGWHPREDIEILSREKMIQEFTLQRVQKGGAVFNPEKLEWLNAQYIKTLSPESLYTSLKSFLPNKWNEDMSFLFKVITITQERMKKLHDFITDAGLFFELPEYSSTLLIWKETSLSITLENLEIIQNLLEKIPEDQYIVSTLEHILFTCAEKRGRGEILWPFRVALSGQVTSSGPIEIAVILGKKKTLARVHYAIQKLKSEI